MTTITNLKLSPTVVESTWIRNIVDDNAVDGVSVIEAIDEYSHVIQSILINSNGSNKWIKLYDGNDVVLGPFALNKNTPLELNFIEPLYCLPGHALMLQTEDEFDVHLIITGSTLPPPLSEAINPTPADGATSVDINPTLSWDSSPQVISAKVYLDGAFMGVSDNGSYTAGTLQPETVYTWRVDDTDGNTTMTGTEWSFTTA